MITRLFLGLQVLLFIPYGIYCLVQPAAMAAGAGLSITSVTGSIEIQTMYGGLQVAVGALCLLGALRQAYENTALTALLSYHCRARGSTGKPGDASRRLQRLNTTSHQLQC